MMMSRIFYAHQECEALENTAADRQWLGEGDLAQEVRWVSGLWLVATCVLGVLGIRVALGPGGFAVPLHHLFVLFHVLFAALDLGNGHFCQAVESAHDCGCKVFTSVSDGSMVVCSIIILDVVCVSCRVACCVSYVGELAAIAWNDRGG